MSILLFLAGMGLTLYGVTLRIESVMHQIVAAIFIVGGITVMSVATVAYHLAVSRQETRMTLEAKDPSTAQMLEIKKGADRQVIMYGLILLIGLCAVIGYKWTH